MLFLPQHEVVYQLLVPLHRYGLRYMKLTDAIHLSAKEGKKITFN